MIIGGAIVSSTGGGYQRRYSGRTVRLRLGVPGIRCGASSRRRRGEGGPMSDSRFKLSMFLHELELPFDQALATAKEIGAEYVWFDRMMTKRRLPR